MGSGSSSDAQIAATTLRSYLEGIYPLSRRIELKQALKELVDENERLREQVNSGRAGREALEGLPEGTLPRV